MAETKKRTKKVQDSKVAEASVENTEASVFEENIFMKCRNDGRSGRKTSVLLVFGIA